jgi:hypothetical protein
MTSMTDPRNETGHDRMPRSIRLGLTLALAALFTGALYLIAVRGEALLVDLAALGSRLWCF